MSLFPYFHSRPSMIPLGDCFLLGSPAFGFIVRARKTRAEGNGEWLSATLTSNMLNSAEEVQRSEKTLNEVQAGAVARKSEMEPRKDKTFISLKDLYS